VSDHILNFEGLGMGSPTPEIRECIVKSYRRGYKEKDITGIFGVSRHTVFYWVKRTNHPGRKNFRDRSRKPRTIHRKITPSIEDAIIAYLNFNSKTALNRYSHVVILFVYDMILHWYTNSKCTPIAFRFIYILRLRSYHIVTVLSP
jgi:transposase-like protein